MMMNRVEMNEEMMQDVNGGVYVGISDKYTPLEDKLSNRGFNVEKDDEMPDWMRTVLQFV